MNSCFNKIGCRNLQKVVFLVVGKCQWWRWCYLLKLDGTKTCCRVSRSNNITICILFVWYTSSHKFHKILSYILVIFSTIFIITYSKPIRLKKDFFFSRFPNTYISPPELRVLTNMGRKTMEDGMNKQKIFAFNDMRYSEWIFLRY